MEEIKRLKICFWFAMIASVMFFIAGFFSSYMFIFSFILGAMCLKILYEIKGVRSHE